MTIPIDGGCRENSRNRLRSRYLWNKQPGSVFVRAEKGYSRGTNRAEAFVYQEQGAIRSRNLGF